MLTDHISWYGSAENEDEASAGPPDVDDTDGLDEEAEFEAWKIRELLRIKRDKEERIA
jgi:microfibrillar-associated protein 1